MNPKGVALERETALLFPGGNTMMLMYAYTSIMVFGASLRFGFVLLRNGLSIFQFYALNISSNSFPNNGEPHYGY